MRRYRQLAEASPAAYLPDLAMSLNTLAIRLSEVGRGEEALEPAQESVRIRRELAESSPAAYLPGLAVSLNNLANHLSDVGRGEEALEPAQESVRIRRELAESSPAAYLPGLAVSLNNLANHLSQANRADQADDQFAGVLSQFADSPLGRGHILTARGQWRVSQNRAGEAILDLAAAVSVLSDVPDYVTRGRVRQILRALREQDASTFDEAWGQTQTAMPVWLRHTIADEGLSSKIIEWVSTADWDASYAYLDDNAAALLTDEAEAAVELLIDANPTASTVREHLELLQAARAHGTEAAYAALQEQLLTTNLFAIAREWLATRTWPESQAFAAIHADQLLHPATLAILDDLGAQNPDDHMLRLHRGLLAHASEAGFDAAYQLRTDSDQQRQLLAADDEPIPVNARLALARLHSGQFTDDPEAHFELAATALGAIFEATAPLIREAAAALIDCANNAAPYERRDFARRLGQVSAENPHFASLTAALQQFLETDSISQTDTND